MKDTLVDPSVLAELSDTMGADFVAELVATFLDDAPNMLDTLKDAYAGQDADAHRRAAHSLKSNAEVFGATVLTRQARAMELSGLPGDASPIADLEATFHDTAAELRSLLDD